MKNTYVIHMYTYVLVKKSGGYLKMNYQAGNETGNSLARRQAEGFFDKFIQGRGLDIGHGGHKLTEECDGWEIDDGDATILDGVEPHSYTWVYASHVLEHIDQPAVAVTRWWDVLKPGGHLIIAVPDEDLYEQGVWPSAFNSDHRHSFTIHKRDSWNKGSSINLLDVVKNLPYHKIVYIKLCDTNYDYSVSDTIVDQPGAERQIEMVVKKEPSTTIKRQDLIATKFNCSCGSSDSLKILYLTVLNKLRTQCTVCGQIGDLQLKNG